MIKNTRKKTHIISEKQIEFFSFTFSYNVQAPWILRAKIYNDTQNRKYNEKKIIISLSSSSKEKITIKIGIFEIVLILWVTHGDNYT